MKNFGVNLHGEPETKKPVWRTRNKETYMENQKQRNLYGEPEIKKLIWRSRNKETYIENQKPVSELHYYIDLNTGYLFDSF